jgi:hypothetical protein
VGQPLQDEVVHGLGVDRSSTRPWTSFGPARLWDANSAGCCPAAMMGVDGLPVPVPGLDPLADLADQGLLASGLALGPRRLVLRAIYALTGPAAAPVGLLYREPRPMTKQRRWR